MNRIYNYCYLPLDAYVRVCEYVTLIIRCTILFLFYFFFYRATIIFTWYYRYDFLTQWYNYNNLPHRKCNMIFVHDSSDRKYDMGVGAAFSIPLQLMMTDSTDTNLNSMCFTRALVQKGEMKQVGGGWGKVKARYALREIRLG